MQKFALLSDIHGCTLGLDLVTKDALSRGVEQFIMCGDYVSDGPESEAVLERIRKLPGYVIRGNREDYMLAYEDGTAHWDNTLQFAPLLWSYKQLSTSSLDYLRGLPSQLSFNAYGYNILVSHGSPYSPTEILRPLADHPRFREICRDFSEDVFIVGHTHDIWGLRFQDRYFINAGTSGTIAPGSYPFSNFSYVIMTVQAQDISFERVRIPCSFEVFEQYFNTNNYLRDNGIWPALILESIKTGLDLCGAFVRYCHELAQDAGLNNYAVFPNEIWTQATATWPYRAVL